MAQANAVADALRAAGSQIELVGVTTEGDRSSAPLVESGGLGVFVTELRRGSSMARIDVVVHSLKDLPTTPAADLRVVAIPPRADARDALVARDGLTLSETACRRLDRHRDHFDGPLNCWPARPDLDIVPLRGNVDTRVRKVDRRRTRSTPSCSPAPALQRLGRRAASTAALLDGAVRCRRLDRARSPSSAALPTSNRVVGSARLFEPLDDPASRAAVTAERTVLAVLEAGCLGTGRGFSRRSTAPSNLHLVAAVVSVDGVTAIRGSADVPPRSRAIGRRLAAELLERGAGALMRHRCR